MCLVMMLCIKKKHIRVYDQWQGLTEFISYLEALFFFFLINLERKFVHAIYVSIAIVNLYLTVMLKIDVSILPFLFFYLLAKL